LANKTLIDGKIRINQRNYEDAFVNDPNGGSDLYICGLKDRNRALNHDIVALKVKEKYYWKILDPFKEIIRRIVVEYDESAGAVQQKNESLTRKESTSGDETLIETGKKDLTDLAPSSYSNQDLLNKLDNNWFQRTAVVVGIIEKKNNRYSAGHLKLFPDKNKDWAQFSPNDSRIPRMRIKMKHCPKDFYTNSKLYANTIFIARIVDIPINSRYAIGELKKMIGREGDIEVETEAILIENGIDYTEFDECINECLPKTPWHIPQSEYDNRRDLRNYCIFTIVIIFLKSKIYFTYIDC
jgi:exoribonuclease R